MLNSLEQFRDAISAAGMEPPDGIHADGVLHRFSPSGKRSDMAGWYVLHGDGIPAGSFGNWRTGHAQSWRADIGRSLSQAEINAHHARIELMRIERQAATAKLKLAAEWRATRMWSGLDPADPDHQYLRRKGVQPFSARQMGAALVLAVRNVDGDIKSLQFIGEDGSKRLMKGGEKRGHFIHVNGARTAQRWLICEGWATGATLAEAFPDDCVIAAIDAGNLLPVAQAIRARFPDAAITICADDDVATPGNPGRTKATAAALAVGAKLAIPDFGDNHPDGCTDFNDLHMLEVRRHG